MPGNGKNAVEWSSADKFGVVLETARMNEAELAEYCRSKGLFVEQVADWREVCQQANAAPGELNREFREQSKTDRKEIKQLKKAIEFLTSKLPAQTEMDKVLDEVWKAAKENKLTVKSVRNGKPVEGSNYNEQPIRMVVEGPFNPSFYKFLSQVEQMPRLTKIKEMKIEPDRDEKKNGMIIADFELTIYYESNQNVAVAK